MRHRLRELVMVSLMAVPVCAQPAPIPFSGWIGTGQEGIEGQATFSLILPIELKANAAYSGEGKTTSVQSSADGAQLNRVVPGQGEKVWRDSQGRLRSEQNFLTGRNGGLKLVEIQDPVAGYVFILDDIAKVAHRVKASVIPERSKDPLAMQHSPAGSVGVISSSVMNAAGGGGDSAAAPSRMPQISAPEDLGLQSLEGIEVHVSRVATVIPAGAEGNDNPITVTRDSWYSPELNLILRTVTNDPRSGVQTSGFDNLSRNEPDPSLFTVPADYSTIDEKSDFTIKWGAKIQK